MIIITAIAVYLYNIGIGDLPNYLEKVVVALSIAIEHLVKDEKLKRKYRVQLVKYGLAAIITNYYQDEMEVAVNLFKENIILFYVCFISLLASLYELNIARNIKSYFFKVMTFFQGKIQSHE